MYKLRREGGVIRLSDNYIILPRTQAWLSEYLPYYRSGGITLDPDPEVIPERTIEQARFEKQKQISKTAFILRDKLTNGLSPAELASWAKKEELARKASASGVAADAGILRNEAQARGISLVSLITKILTKADAFWAVEAQIAGNTGKHLDALALLQTIEEVDNYDFSSGWPNL